MADLNKVLLIGNLTRDPVSRSTSGGTMICELGLAINRRFRTAGGEDREETCFVDIDVFGRQAEHCARYLRKGSLTFVEGRLRYDQWEDRNTGQKRSRLKVTAERVQFLDSRSRQDDGQQGGGYQEQDGGYQEQDGGSQQQGGGYQQQGGGYQRQQQGGGYRQEAAPARPYPQREQPRSAPPPRNVPPPAETDMVHDDDEPVDDIPF